MRTKRIQRFSVGLGLLVAALGVATLGPKAYAAETTTGLQPLQAFKLAHCCHAHPIRPYDRYCCHPSTRRVYVAPRYGVGRAGVRGVSRRTSRRTSRRVGRRR